MLRSSFIAAFVVHVLLAIPILAQEKPGCDILSTQFLKDCVKKSMGAVSSNTPPSMICLHIQQAASCYSPACCADPAMQPSIDEQMKQLSVMAEAMGTTCPVTCGGDIPTPSCDAGEMAGVSSCVKDQLSLLAGATGFTLVVGESGAYNLNPNRRLAPEYQPRFDEGMVCTLLQRASSCFSPACCAGGIDSTVKALVDEQMALFDSIAANMGVKCPLGCGNPPPPSGCDVSAMPSVSDCVNTLMGAISSNTEVSSICPIIQKAASCYPQTCCADPAVQPSVDEQMKQLAVMAETMGTTCPVTCGGEIPTPSCDAGEMAGVSSSGCVKDQLSLLAGATGFNLVDAESGVYNLIPSWRLAPGYQPRFDERMVCTLLQKASSCFSPGCCAGDIDSTMKALVDEQIALFDSIAANMGVKCRLGCGNPPPPSGCDVSAMPSVSDCVNTLMGAISSSTEVSSICPIIQQAASCYPLACCADPAVQPSVDEQMNQLAVMAETMGTTCPVACGWRELLYRTDDPVPEPPSPPFCAAPALCLDTTSSRVFVKVAPNGLLEIYLRREWSGLRWILSSNRRRKVLKFVKKETVVDPAVSCAMYCEDEGGRGCLVCGTYVKYTYRALMASPTRAMLMFTHGRRGSMRGDRVHVHVQVG